MLGIVSVVIIVVSRITIVVIVVAINGIFVTIIDARTFLVVWPLVFRWIAIIIIM